MFRTAVLLLALSGPIARADTGTGDTGAAEDTGSASSGDTGSENTPNTRDPDVLDADSQNTGTAGSPVPLAGRDTGGCGGGSMALLALPLLLGWRHRRS
jgi:hypothetical protein